MSKITKKSSYYRKKGNWSSNIKEINNVSQINQEIDFYITEDLCANPPQTVGTVSQPYVAKNIELQGLFEATGAANYEDLCVYIMYLPQGYTVDIDFIKYHPEYIMAVKFFGGADQTVNYRNPLYIKTRLARKLNTGDKLILFIKGHHIGTNGDTIKLSGVVRWWTKSN